MAVAQCGSKLPVVLEHFVIPETLPSSGDFKAQSRYCPGSITALVKVTTNWWKLALKYKHW